MKIHLHTVAALALCGLLSSPATQAQNVTLAQWLNAQLKPAFKTGHTLPRLTRYAYAMEVDARIKLCEDWGYALEYGSGNGVYVGDDNVARLNDPTTPEAQMAALTVADPVLYPLVVVCQRRTPDELEAPDGFTRDVNGQLVYTGTLQQPDGTIIPAGVAYTPAGPASTWELAGEYRAAPFRAMIARGIPISMVLNGGEYGLLEEYNGARFWGQDPRFNAAVNASPWGQGDRRAYSSAKKKEAEKIIATAVRAAIPGLQSYNYYVTGGRPERNRYTEIDSYGGYWEHSRGINDLPSSQHYHASQNNGFTGVDGQGRRDILTQALNAKALEILSGDPLSYDWISAGWDGNASDVNRWVGFLKCIYTAGTIGTNTGAYEAPPGNGSYIGHTFPASSPPEYAKNLAASGYVHALFSQLDNLTRNSDLLPGPANHVMSVDVPAYEFPTGDNDARVLARKHRTQASWVVTAWAAGGTNRDVTVFIPEIGNITLEARIVGSVYKVTVSNGSKTVIRIDNQGATYTVVADGTPVVSPINLSVPAPVAANRLLWLSADSGVTTDSNGKVSSWASQGNASLTVDQSNASLRPTLVANGINGKPALRFSNPDTILLNTALGTNGDAFIGDVQVFAIYTNSAPEARFVTNGVTAGGAYTSPGQGFAIVAPAAGTNNPAGTAFLGRAGGSRVGFDTRMDFLSIGDLRVNVQYGLIGDVAEVLMYKALTPLEIAKVEEYLKDKYAIKPNTSLINGDFESPAVTGYRLTPNQTAGWFFTNNSAIQANGSAWNAASAPAGIQTAVLQGYGRQLGSMSQMVNLTAGSYTLSLKAARRSSDAGGTQPVKISVNQTQIGSLITPSGNSFEDFTVNFTVSAGKHTIRLDATNGSGNGNSTFIDQVVLAKAAAPAALQGGSFENPVVNGFQYNPIGSGWAFNDRSIIQANGSAWGAATAPDGNQTAVLQGAPSGLGAISQTVSFTAGTYTVSYKSARRGSQIQPVRFSVDGTQVGNPISPASTSFASNTTASFTVAGGEHTLRFEATDGSGDLSVFIDQVTLAPAAAAAVSFSGGSFETPAVNGFQYNPTGSGWTFNDWSVIQANGSVWSAANAPAGIQTAVLQGSPGGLGAISQESTFAAGTYTVSFQAARRPEPYGGLQPIKVSIDGTQVGSLVSPTSTAFEVYYTAVFTVTAGNHTLRLEATDGSSSGNSTFIDDVQLNTALGSLNTSIGTVNPVGSGTLSGAGVYTIKGSGLGITGTADKGHLYYDKLTGNGSIVAKVLSVQNTNASAKAGIMIRETTATGSKNVFLAFTPNGTVNFQRRTALGGTTTNTTAVAAIPSWIKLTRVGNTFQAHRSTNGTTWVAVGAAVTNAMTSDVLIGLGVSSNTSTTACTATFSNVTLTGAITRL